MTTLYHMQSQDQRKHAVIVRGVIVLCVAVLVVACCVIYQVFHQSSLEQGAISVKQAVLDSALQCAAIEGSYPSELSHLEENYGLSINHNDYIVTYDCFASNVIPSVSVVVR